MAQSSRLADFAHKPRRLRIRQVGGNVEKAHGFISVACRSPTAAAVPYRNPAGPGPVRDVELQSSVSYQGVTAKHQQPLESWTLYLATSAGSLQETCMEANMEPRNSESSATVSIQVFIGYLRGKTERGKSHGNPGIAGRRHPSSPWVGWDRYAARQDNEAYSLSLLELSSLRPYPMSCLTSQHSVVLPPNTTGDHKLSELGMMTGQLCSPK
ncbi:uncharacterized protein CLUP02_00168 [Colletotrichum lupini]|uniref:Uncharacterized protein n=1 Tax=Colletotrichum lupini TaxID=145971 RepID=A0A9Q8W6F1_9PEZI|nr:uncharacterized protein CLUP02_00168 [Colletotrichum lupini]UQC73523.1 hypothetical protein CLUP02_00168 [Colletotrichum lupini]